MNTPIPITLITILAIVKISDAIASILYQNVLTLYIISAFSSGTYSTSNVPIIDEKLNVSKIIADIDNTMRRAISVEF